MTRLRFGVIGLGYWGPNLVRISRARRRRGGVDLRPAPGALRKISQRYPAVRCTERLDDVSRTRRSTRC